MPDPQILETSYRNWQGVWRVRRLLPKRLWYGTNMYHQGAQWFVDATDQESGEQRTFALDQLNVPRVPSDATFFCGVTAGVGLLVAAFVFVCWLAEVKFQSIHNGQPVCTYTQPPRR